MGTIQTGTLLFSLEPGTKDLLRATTKQNVLFIDDQKPAIGRKQT